MIGTAGMIVQELVNGKGQCPVLSPLSSLQSLFLGDILTLPPLLPLSPPPTLGILENLGLEKALPAAFDTAAF